MPTHLSRFAAIAAVIAIVTVGESFAAAEAGRAKPVIAKGMPAATVRDLIGEPAEIRKIEAQGAKGESWIYRRKMSTEVTQEAVLLEQVPAFVGLGYGNSDNIAMIDVPAYRLKRTTHTQVTALLMVEDTLILARQWVERDTAFEN